MFDKLLLSESSPVFLVHHYVHFLLVVLCLPLGQTRLVLRLDLWLQLGPELTKQVTIILTKQWVPCIQPKITFSFQENFQLRMEQYFVGYTKNFETFLLGNLIFLS